MRTVDFERLVESVKQMAAAKLADSKRLPGVVVQPAPSKGASKPKR